MYKVRHCILYKTTIMHTHMYIHTHAQNKSFPLYNASHEGRDRIVKMLLQAGATVNQQTKVEHFSYDSILVSVLLAAFIVH